MNKIDSFPAIVIFHATIITTIGLLLGAISLQLIQLVFSMAGNSSAPAGFGGNTIAAGIIAESIRGFILAWLYSKHEGAGRSLKNALVFGVAASLLVGTLWVILGHTAYDLPNQFLLHETFVIIVQGIFSGIGLWLVFRTRYRTP